MKISESGDKCNFVPIQKPFFKKPSFVPIQKPFFKKPSIRIFVIKRIQGIVKHIKAPAIWP